MRPIFMIPVTEVEGVGPVLARFLAQLRITTAADLSLAEPEDLVVIPAVGRRRAETLIEAARIRMALAPGSAELATMPDGTAPQPKKTTRITGDGTVSTDAGKPARDGKKKKKRRKKKTAKPGKPA